MKGDGREVASVLTNSVYILNHIDILPNYAIVRAQLEEFDHVKLSFTKLA